jgi:hypothetical protein
MVIAIAELIVIARLDATVKVADVFLVRQFSLVDVNGTIARVNQDVDVVIIVVVTNNYCL